MWCVLRDIRPCTATYINSSCDYSCDSSVFCCQPLAPYRLDLAPEINSTGVGWLRWILIGEWIPNPPTSDRFKATSNMILSRHPLSHPHHQKNHQTIRNSTTAIVKHTHAFYYYIFLSISFFFFFFFLVFYFPKKFFIFILLLLLLLLSSYSLSSSSSSSLSPHPTHIEHIERETHTIKTITAACHCHFFLKSKKKKTFENFFSLKPTQINGKSILKFFFVQFLFLFDLIWFELSWYCPFPLNINFKDDSRESFLLQ